MYMFSMNLFEHNVSFAGREKLSAMPAGGAAPAAAAAAAPAAAAAEEKKGQFCTLLPLSNVLFSLVCDDYQFTPSFD